MEGGLTLWAGRSPQSFSSPTFLSTIMKAIITNRAGQKDDHHIWWNRSLYWVHFTVYGDDYTVERMRFSLKTKDKDEAIKRRDIVFAYMEEHSGAVPDKNLRIKLWTQQ